MIQSASTHWLLASTIVLTNLACSKASPLDGPRDQAKRGEAERIRTHARTPALAGPDIIERSAVVVISGDDASLDGRSVTPDKLADELARQKSLYVYLNPSSPFRGQFVLACAPELPTPELETYLSAAVKGGYWAVQFAFLKPVPDSEWSTGSAATAFIGGTECPARESERCVQIRAHTDCLGLSKTLVSLRSQGVAVRLLLSSGLHDEDRPTRR
jgi:hypothetical protein